MTPLECYKLYNSLKLHFTQPNYDFFKYQGKTQASFDSFNRRRDRFHFAKLARSKYPQETIIANFVSDSPPKWIGDLISEQAQSVCLEYMKRQQSLEYIVENDIKNIPLPFVDSFKVKGGQHPIVLKMYLQKQISIETLVVLDNAIKFFDVWDNKIQDPIIWPNVKLKCQKYKPFLPRYDKKKIKEKILLCMSESV